MSPRGVNVGPDARLPWPFGPIFGRLQEERAFKSGTPPIKMVWRPSEDRLAEVSYSVPHARAFYGWATRRPDGRWDTFRIGYRWDVNWGDEQVRGFNPEPDVVGGYFPDVIVKKGQAVPHISTDGVASVADFAAATLQHRREWWEPLAPVVARLVGAR